MKTSITNKKNIIKKLKLSASYILLLLLVLIFWWLGNNKYGNWIIPNPINVFRKIFQFCCSSKAIENLSVSFIRILKGLALSILIGCLSGFILGSNKFLKKLLSPFVYFFQCMPPIIYIVIALIWFGLNGGTAIFIIFITTVPIITISIWEGLNNIDQGLLEMAEVYKLKKRQVILDIIIPSILPQFKTSLILTIGIAWRMVLMSETFGTSKGIGTMLMDARLNIQTDMVFALGIIVVILGLLTEHIVELIFRRLLKWKME